MALPANISTVTVRGTFLNASGAPVTPGVVTFTPSVGLVDTSSVPPVVILNFPVIANLDAAGSFAVQLPATDDPDVAPSGFTYRVEEVVGVARASYSILLPAATPNVDLATVTPVADVAVVSQFARLATPNTFTADQTVTGRLTVSGRLTAAGFALPLVAPSIRPPKWRDPSTIVSNFQAAHGWTVEGAGVASSSNDTTVFVKGTQSLRVTTNGTGGQANIRLFAGAAQDLTGKAIRLVFRVNDMARVASLNFFAGTSSLVNNFKWRFNAATATTQIAKNNEWVVVTLQWSELNTAAGTFTISAAGVPSVRSGFTDLQFQVVDNSAALTFWLQSIEIIDAELTKYPKGVVSVTFDDSWDSQYDLAKPKMDALGYRGSLHTIVEQVGQASKLTLAELHTMQDMSGWEVAGHAFASSAHTARYTTIAAAAVDDDLRNLRAWLVSNGFTGDSFAYPGGQFENTTDGVPVDQLVARYFSSGRSILSNTDSATHTVIDAVPAAMLHRLRGMSSITELQVGPNKPANLIAAGGMLDKVANNGGWLELVFHKIVTGTPVDSTECSKTDFDSIMNGINSRGIAVRTVGEVLRS